MNIDRACLEAELEELALNDSASNPVDDVDDDSCSIE